MVAAVTSLLRKQGRGVRCSDRDDIGTPATPDPGRTGSRTACGRDLPSSDQDRAARRQACVIHSQPVPMLAFGLNNYLGADRPQPIADASYESRAGRWHQYSTGPATPACRSASGPTAEPQQLANDDDRHQRGQDSEEADDEADPGQPRPRRSVLTSEVLAGPVLPGVTDTNVGADVG